MKWLAIAVGLLMGGALVSGCSSPSRTTGSAAVEPPRAAPGPGPDSTSVPSGSSRDASSRSPSASGNDRPATTVEPSPRAPQTRTPAPVRSESESALRALERSAGLDSPLKRKIQEWDRTIEAGLQAQAAVRWKGQGTLEPVRKQLQARVDSGRAGVVDLYLLGRVKGKMGLFEEARRCFCQALERDPEFLYAYEGLAVCEQNSPGKQEKADQNAILGQLKKAFRIWGDFPRGHLIHGMVLIEAGKPDAGLAALARIPEDHPLYANAAVAATKAYQQLGELDLALNRLSLARKKKPDDLDLDANYGLLLLQMARESGPGSSAEGRLKEAEKTLAHVLSRAPRHPEARIGLAFARLLRGQPQEARKLFVDVANDASLPRSYRVEAARWSRRIEQGGATGTKRSAAEVLAVLQNDPDPEHRREAASLLVKVRAKPVLMVFVQKLDVQQEPDEGVRVFAVKALGCSLRADDVSRLLAPRLDPGLEPSRLVRGAVAGALRRVPLEQAPLATLVQALEDPEPYVFREIRTTLQELTGKCFHMDFGGELTASDKASVIQAWKAWYKAWLMRHESRKG